MTKEQFETVDRVIGLLQDDAYKRAIRYAEQGNPYAASARLEADAWAWVQLAIEEKWYAQ